MRSMNEYPPTLRNSAMGALHLHRLVDDILNEHFASGYDPIRIQRIFIVFPSYLAITLSKFFILY